MEEDNISGMDGNDRSPPHWWKAPDRKKFPNKFLLFRTLCLIAISRPSVEHLWVAFTQDNEWEKQRSRILRRLNNINIIAGLLLTTTSAFLSSHPPLASLVPYTMKSSYVFDCFSFTHALGGLMCGLAVVNVYDACDRTWAKDVMTSSRFRLCCTLLFVGWSSISVIISIIFLIISLLIASYSSAAWWFKLLATMEVMSWVWLPLLFLWCALR